MDNRAPGVMGLYAKSLAEQQKKGREAGKAHLQPVFAEEPEEVSTSPASVVSEPAAAKKVEKAERPAAKGSETVELIDTDLIDPWEFADRPDDEFGDLESLTDNIRIHGQETPILVRPNKKAKGRYELIYGRRRWTVCKDLGIKVKAFVRNYDDRQAYAAMYRENSERKDISSWARAVSYRKALDKGLYESESALAANLGISRATMSNIMVYTRIPGEVAAAIGPMHNVSILTAKAILRCASGDEESVERLISVADKIQAGELTGDKVEKAVVASSTKRSSETKIVTDSQGRKLFSYRDNGRTFLELNFYQEAEKKAGVDKIVNALKELFSNANES